MDQSQQSLPKQPELQSAVTYYNKNRKRSFLLSRVTVIASMFVLVIALGINIVAFYSQDNQTTQSHASSPENPKKLLPSLPAGCSYKEIKGGMTVICPSAIPTKGAEIPINVQLPQLPPECNLVTSTSGSALHCTAINVPIPTVPVTLPLSCEASNQPYAITCKNINNETVTVHLPALPVGCSYRMLEGKYYVVCQPRS